jgi:integrase
MSVVAGCSLFDGALLAADCRITFQVSPNRFFYTDNAQKLFTLTSRLSIGFVGDLLDRAGIKDFRFHDLRHTFASWYMMNGGDLYELAKILGHSNIKMTERYAKLAREHIARTSSTAREMWKLLEPVCDKANVG